MDVSSWLLAAYIAIHLPLCVYGLHRGWLILGLRGRAWRPEPAPLVDPPWVTVQLPVFNERHVVERIIHATSRLDWPRDRLEIQVLDDSTDDTTALAQAACAGLRAKGFFAVVRHRTDRSGFKAGALAEGLAQARGDLIAIFDADFLPPVDFLQRTVPYLLSGAGMVQARWGHLNRAQSLLTRLQAALLDGHFAVEQVSRARRGHWFQFNGTAGIWTRHTIQAAGGWHSDTLTEDLDLSYRAQIAGSRFVYLDDLVAPAELPADLAAFKAQQHRWGKGMAQALRKSAWRVLSARVTLAIRLEALVHLSSALAWPLVTLVSILLPLTLLARFSGWLVVPAVVDVGIFSAATVLIAVFYAVAAARAASGDLGLRLAVIPLAMALGVGLSVAQSAAVLQGLFGQTGTFERTPKAGDTVASTYRARWRPVVLLELAMAVWLLGAAGVALWAGFFAAVPFLVFLGLGYGLIGAGGVRDRLRSARATSHTITPTTGSQVTNHSHPGSDHAPVRAS